MWNFHIYVTPMLPYFIMLTVTDTLPFRIQNFFSYSTVVEYSTVEWRKGSKGRRHFPFHLCIQWLKIPEWQKVSPSSPPPREAFVLPHLEPRVCVSHSWWETLHVQYTRATKRIGGGVRDYVKEVCALYQLVSTFACVLALNHWFRSGLENRLPEVVWLSMQLRQNLLIYSLTFQCL